MGRNAAVFQGVVLEVNIPKILEGLHCCSMLKMFRDCESCPYGGETICMDNLLSDAEKAILQRRGGKRMKTPENFTYCDCKECVNTDCERHYSRMHQVSRCFSSDFSVCCLNYRKGN